MKNKKLFIGIVAVAAVVCLNLRHAWRNYGIAENRIMAGAMAGSPNPEEEDSTTCPKKEGYEITGHNLEIDSSNIHKVSCPIAQITTYYIRYFDGYERVLATVTHDYKTGGETKVPKTANLSTATRDKKEEKFQLYTIREYACTKHKKGNCCYANTFKIDCKKLISGTN